MCTCGPQDALTREGEHALQVAAGSQVTAANLDSLEDGLHQRQFVAGGGEPHQHQPPIPPQRAERVRDRAGGCGQYDGGIGIARFGRGARGACGRGLFRRRIHHRSAQSLVERELQRQVSQSAEAEQGNCLARLQAGFAQGAESGPPGAAQRRRHLRRQIVGHAHQPRCRRQHPVAKSTLQGVPEVGLLRAEAFPSAGAPRTRPAGGPQEGDAGAIAGLPFRDPVAHRLNASDAFMAQPERRQRQLRQAADKQVGVAQTAGVDAQPYLARPRFARLPALDFDPAARLAQHYGNTLHHARQYIEIAFRNRRRSRRRFPWIRPKVARPTGRKNTR